MFLPALHCETNAYIPKGVRRCTARLMLEKHKYFRSAKKLGKPRNVSKNMASEQDQVFGANPKIGLRKKKCFCRALT